nr:hypothetical protein [Tanacetum cinerariifolium]
MAPKRTTRSTADQETINTTLVTNAQLQAMIDQGVTAALAARNALRNTNGDDSHNSRMGVRRTERATRECTYTDFLKCQPLHFKGIDGVASLSQWFERMESVFHISNCTVENQVEFATCTLHSVTLTWWNTHVNAVGHDAAYGMPWKTLMKMMTDKYCPRNEIRKLEMEMWDLKVKGTDLASYTQRFQELALLCGRMFSEESDKIEKYIGGLPNMIYGSVVASKPKTMQEAVEIATELMDKKIRTFSERETVNKRKFENTLRNTQNQQQQSNKRQNTDRVNTTTSGEKNQYGGSKPLCAKCNYHHDGPCAPKCHNCNKVGHFPVIVGIWQIPIMLTIRGALGGRNNAPARVYAVGRTGTDPDANVVTEPDKIEKYVGGLPDMIHGSVVASKPKTMQEAIEIATELMDKKIRTFAELETASKRKSVAITNNANNQRGTGSGQKLGCYECGVQGHFKRECPKLKNNNNHGNQGGRNNAPARVYAVGRVGIDPNANVIMDLLEDPYVEVVLQPPPSPDYILGPEEPEQAPPSLDYVLGPEHADDEIVAKDQPYAEDASPIAQSPEYDDEDDEMDIEADEEDEEEHPAPADSVVVAPTAADQAPSAKETEPFEIDESAATPPPHPAYRTTARMSIPAPVPMPAWTDSVIVRLLAISSPPASLLSPWSSPPPQIPFPPLPLILSPRSPVLSPGPPPSPIRSLGYRATMIRLRDKAASTSLPPLQLASASRREDRPEVTLPPRKRLDIALGPRYEVGESSSATAARPAGGFRADYGFVATMDREIMRDPEREVGYGITDSWDEILETLQGAPVSIDTKLDGYAREFETRVRQDTDEIYMRVDDEQTERQLLAGRLNMLFRDRLAHAYTRHLMETKETMSREAWGQVTALQAQVTTLQGEQGLAGDPTQLELPEEAGGRVTAALAAGDALRSKNGDNSHNSRTSVRRMERATRECTYTDFLKCQPLPFKGTEGVASVRRMERATRECTYTDFLK